MSDNIVFQKTLKNFERKEGCYSLCVLNVLRFILNITVIKYYFHFSKTDRNLRKRELFLLLLKRCSCTVVIRHCCYRMILLFFKKYYLKTWNKKKEDHSSCSFAESQKSNHDDEPLGGTGTCTHYMHEREEIIFYTWCIL